MTSRAGGAMALAVATALAGCSAPQVQTAAAPAAPAQSTPVGAAGIAALYATAHREDGVVLNGAHAGVQWTKWVQPDGSVKLSAAQGLFTDTGKFVIRGDEVCSSWSHIDAGQETCMRLVQTGADTYTTYLPDGSAESTFRVARP